MPALYIKYMAGSKISRAQKSAYDKMLEIIKHPDFQKDIADIRTRTETHPVLNEVSQMILKKYKLPRLCYPLIQEYVINGGFRQPQDIPAPVFLLSTKDNYSGPDIELPMNVYFEAFPADHVMIDLTGEIKKTDLIEFINKNWKLIEQKLQLIEADRPGPVQPKQFNKLHLEVLKLYEEKGLSYREIAGKLNLTEKNVSQIIYRLRGPRRSTK